MGRMDGEITLATVIRYIRPMDTAVSDVFRRHDRRMEHWRQLYQRNPLMIWILRMRSDYP